MLTRWATTRGTPFVHAAMLGALCAVAPMAHAQAKSVTNIVLVHGAADGSGWKGVPR